MTNILNEMAESLELSESDSNRYWSVNLECWVSVPSNGESDTDD